MNSKEKFASKFLISFLPLFLLVFMGVIFGPIEIFFGNYKDLGLIFSDFGWLFVAAGLAIVVIGGFVLALMPSILRKISVAFIWATAIAAYIQVMFLNKGLSQLGVDAQGFQTTFKKEIGNTLIWFAILTACFLVVFLCKERWQNIVKLSSLCLVLVQLVAMSTLFLTAEKACFELPESQVCLDASEQYTVSSKENVIVLVLDNFPNEWLYEARLADENILSCMKDFTYYNNADCCYWGTYPSIVHMLTGNPMDLGLSVNEYTSQCWDNEKTNRFFEVLQENDYKLNVYTNILSVIVGANPLEIAEGKISNITRSELERKVDFGALCNVMARMSCYRYAPNILKEEFNVRNDEYSRIVTDTAGEVAYWNPDFYNGLVENGISVSDSSNYYSFIHLNGTHEFVNDEYCVWDRTITERNRTIKGVFYMLEEYFEQLKLAGAYDNSTIIVLSDHGTGENGQPIFFIKNKDEVHDTMQETTAPIDYTTLLPTIAEAMGADGTEFGKSIWDYQDGEWRERTYIERAFNPNYPLVKRYDGIADATTNVWHVYKYTGDMWYLMSEWQLFHYETISMVDSMY